MIAIGRYLSIFVIICNIVSTVNAHSLISDMKVLYNFISSDHLPVCFNINWNNMSVDRVDNEKYLFRVKKIRWDLVKPDQLLMYRHKTLNGVSSIVINSDMLCCDGNSCPSESVHRLAITDLTEFVATLYLLICRFTLTVHEITTVH